MAKGDPELDSYAAPTKKDRKAAEMAQYVAGQEVIRKKPGASYAKIADAMGIVGKHKASEARALLTESDTAKEMIEKLREMSITGSKGAMELLTMVANNPQHPEWMKATQMLFGVWNKNESGNITIIHDNRQINIPFQQKDWGVDDKGVPYHRPTMEMAESRADVAPACRERCSLLAQGEAIGDALFSSQKEKQ